MRKSSLFVLLPVIALTACGGDDKLSTAATATKGDAFCTAVAAFKTQADAFNPIGQDPAELEAEFTKLLAASRSLSKIAPKDIASDVAAATKGQEQFGTLLKKANWDIVAAASDPQFAELSASQDAVTGRLDTYTEEKCGIKKSDDSATADSTSDTGSGASLPPGVVTRENLLDLYAIGAGVEVTAEQRQCFLDATEGISDEDFTAALSGTAPSDVSMKLGTAMISCKIITP